MFQSAVPQPLIGLLNCVLFGVWRRPTETRASLPATNRMSPTGSLVAGCPVEAKMKTRAAPGRPPRPGHTQLYVVAQTRTHYAFAPQTKLLERVLKLRQREALLLLDDGLLFHNLDVHALPPEPLHDVLVDPGRRRQSDPKP